MEYDAFVSYSHAADGELAPALQRALEKFAKKWTRRRALHVFRDDTGLSVNPALWSSIEEALDHSRFFILLASPDASSSGWVNREVDRWLELGRKDRILPVVTDGGWVWDLPANDFDWTQSTAVPPRLRGAFSEEPRHLDLRWARSQGAGEKLTLQNSDFRSAVADLAAPIHGQDKDSLEGQDLREFRKARRYRRIATLALAAMVLLLAAATVAAFRSAEEARRQEQEALRQEQAAHEQAMVATSRQLAAQSVSLASSELDLSLLLALSAIEIDDSADARGALLTSLEENPNLLAYVRATDGTVGALAASNNSLLAIGETSGVLRVLDFNDLAERASISLGANESISSLAFSQSGDVLAIGTETGDVAVWSWNETTIPTVLPLAVSDAPVTSLAFDVAGQQVAAVWARPDTREDVGERVAVWDTDDGRSSLRFGPSQGPIGMDTISFPDSDGLIVIGAFEMQRFDLASGTLFETWSLEFGGAQPGPSAHTRGGEVGAWSTLDRGDIGIYIPGASPDDSEELAYIDIGGGANDLLQWDEIGSTLGVVKEGTILLFDALGEELVRMTGAESSIVDLAFNMDSDRVASLGNGVVQIWSPSSASRLASGPPSQRSEPPNVLKRVIDVDFSEDGRFLAWVDPDGVHPGAEDPLGGGNVAVWDMESSELVTVNYSATPCHVAFVTSDVFAADSRGCDDEPAVEFWDTAGRPRDSLNVECFAGGPGSWASTDLHVASDGHATSCVDGRSVAVDIDGILDRLGATPDATIAAISHDGSRVSFVDRTNGIVATAGLGVSGIEHSTTKVHSSDTGETATPYLSPDGSILVVSEVELDLTRSTIGHLVATLWNTESGDQIGEIGPASIDDIAFTPDGSLVAIAKSGGEIELRDAASLRIMTILPGDGDAPIRTLEFSPDGLSLAEASSGGGIALWDLDHAAWARRACGMVGRDLTADEITVFLGGVDATTAECGNVEVELAEIAKTSRRVSPSPAISG